MDVDELAVAARDDPTVAERLFELVRNDLERHVRRYFAGLDDEIDDVVQSSLAVLHRKLDCFEPRGPNSFLHWARGVARFEAKEALRRRKRRIDLRDRAAMKTVVSPPTNLSSRIQLRQCLAIVREEVRALSPAYRRAVEDVLAEGDVEAHAEREQVTVSTVRANRWRARKRLGQLVSARLGLGARPKFAGAGCAAGPQPSLLGPGSSSTSPT